MKTSQVKAYYERYMHAVSKYGYRGLNDCYKNPSRAKVKAERENIKECYVDKGGYGYSVISYNTNIFTCGYLFNRDGVRWFAVHTPNYYGEIRVEED